MVGCGGYCNARNEDAPRPLGLLLKPSTPVNPDDPHLDTGHYWCRAAFFTPTPRLRAGTGTRTGRSGKSRSVLGDVDLAGELVAPGNHEQTTEGEVLADHQAEFRDLGVFEVFPEFLLEVRINAAEVRGKLLREAYREGVAGLEFALGFG